MFAWCKLSKEAVNVHSPTTTPILHHWPAGKLTNLVMLIKCQGTCLFLLLWMKYTWSGERTQSSRQGVQASTVFSKHRGRSGSSVCHDSAASCTSNLLCRMKHKFITTTLYYSDSLWKVSSSDQLTVQLISLLIYCWKTMRFRKRQYRKWGIRKNTIWDNIRNAYLLFSCPYILLSICSKWWIFPYCILNFVETFD